jgi:hypothetical protein
MDRIHLKQDTSKVNKTLKKRIWEQTQSNFKLIV